ncbi:MAG: acyl-CoA dehydrogenase family protein [Planctomycetota bacterium]
MTTTLLHPCREARGLFPKFARLAARHDASDAFVADNYADLKECRIFSAMVPEELGGSGVSHREMCAFLRELAHHCSSTALALSMHQHLVAAATWGYRNGRPGEKLLRHVAASETVLVSTGARDWLDSNGSMERVDGGYRVSARKFFASGSPAGGILVTSAPYDDPAEGPQVLHFGVPFSAEGVSIDEVWFAHGMRGTGSNTVVLDNVFVPEAAVSLRRPQGDYHPIWNVVLTVAMPLISAVYAGIAGAASKLVLNNARSAPPDPSRPYLIGEMQNLVTTARIAADSMAELANDLDIKPRVEIANQILVRKTIATESAAAAVDKALEASGGGGYFRSSGLERLLRDVRAGQFHPLQPKKQHLFTGRLALGLDPID